MTTIIQKDSSGDSSGLSALAIVLIVCVLLAVGIGLAYNNGFFTGPTTVIEKNNTVIEHKTIVLPAPETAPEPAK